MTVSGERLALTGLRQILRRRARAAGVERPSIHSFRRGFATLMLKNGCDIESLRKMLGHSSLEVTMRYLRMETEDLKQAHAKSGPVDNLQ
jgi:integrase/recombinase XerD